MNRKLERQINVTLDVLLRLYEYTEDGAERDEISHVRHMLNEVADGDRSFGP